MKRIKAHVNSYCQFCKADGKDKVRATWRDDYNHQRACDAHKGQIKECQDDGHRSEADYQTWMRL
jgi:hypothetical protein